MSVWQVFYSWTLVLASIWALVSALGVAACVALGGERVAWVCLASFALSALAAAYGFGRLL